MDQGFHVASGTLTSFLVLLLFMYGIPWIVTELLIWRGSSSAKRRGAMGFRVACLFAAVVISAVWMWLVFSVTHAGQFGPGHIIGAGLSGIAGMYLLVWWGLKRIKSWLVVALVSGFYSALGVGASFGLYGSSTDITGLWGVGMIYVAMFSLAACFLLAFTMVAIRRSNVDD